jgi:plasmid stabilization system protein ParE
MARRYRVEITRTAERDVEAIYDVIAGDNPTAARKWVAEVERQISTLEQSPARCPIIPEAADLSRGYRHLLYGPYRTIIKINGSRVIVIRVVHGARLLTFTLWEES